MDGRYPGIVHRQRGALHSLCHQGGANAFANLRGGVLGKRDGQHLVKTVDKRARLRRQRPQDAARQRKGFARTRARGHKELAVQRGHDVALLGHKR